MKTALKILAFIIFCLVIPVLFAIQVFKGTGVIFGTIAGFVLFLLLTTLFANLTIKK